MEALNPSSRVKGLHTAEASLLVSIELLNIPSLITLPFRSPRFNTLPFQTPCEASPTYGINRRSELSLVWDVVRSGVRASLGKAWPNRVHMRRKRRFVKGV